MDGTKEIASKIKFIKESVSDLVSQVKAEKEVIASSFKKEMGQIVLIIGALVGGLVLLAMAGLIFPFFLILLTDLVIEKLWLSTLLVLLGYAVLGGALAAIGATKLKKLAKIVPEGFRNFLKEDPQGAKIERQAMQIKTAADEVRAALLADIEAKKAKAKVMSENLKKAAPAIVMGLVGMRILRRKKK
ncbi:MAG: phage holin family protein [Candidatus Geothermincolia bacterium]